MNKWKIRQKSVNKINNIKNLLHFMILYLIIY